jgi:hypothetical protein
MRAAQDDEYYSWRKSFLYKRQRDFFASILKGEGGSTFDAIRDAAYSERLATISLYMMYLKRRWKTYLNG